VWCQQVRRALIEETYDKCAHAEEYEKPDLLLQWERQGPYHRYRKDDDEKVAADVENCLNNGEVLQRCALWVGWRDSPVASKRSASSEEGNLNRDPAEYDPYRDDFDPFAVCGA
jgi:hypothetical protein